MKLRSMSHNATEQKHVLTTSIHYCRRRHLQCFGEPPRTKLTSICFATVLERSGPFNVADALGSVIENFLETFGATVRTNIEGGAVSEIRNIFEVNFGRAWPPAIANAWGRPKMYGHIDWHSNDPNS